MCDSSDNTRQVNLKELLELLNKEAKDNNLGVTLTIPSELQNPNLLESLESKKRTRTPSPPSTPPKMARPIEMPSPDISVLSTPGGPGGIVPPPSTPSLSQDVTLEGLTQEFPGPLSPFATPKKDSDSKGGMPTTRRSRSSRRGYYEDEEEEAAAAAAEEGAPIELGEMAPEIDGDCTILDMFLGASAYGAAALGVCYVISNNDLPALKALPTDAINSINRQIEIYITQIRLDILKSDTTELIKLMTSSWLMGLGAYTTANAVTQRVARSLKNLCKKINAARKGIKDTPLYGGRRRAASRAAATRRRKRIGGKSKKVKRKPKRVVHKKK